jgi:hypothetical protein
MKRLAITCHLLAVIIAASYLTLIASDLGEAKRLVPLYGTVVFFLTIFNLWSEHRGQKC